MIIEIQRHDDYIVANAWGPGWAPRAYVYLYAWGKGEAWGWESCRWVGRWDWVRCRPSPDLPDHPGIAAVVEAVVSWARTPEGQAWIGTAMQSLEALRVRCNMLRPFYRLAILHGWTPGTVLQRTLRGKAKSYMGRYLGRLMRALEADETAGRAARVKSVGGRTTWVPVSDQVEALEPVRDCGRLIGWMTSAGIIMTPAEYLAAVGMAERDTVEAS